MEITDLSHPYFIFFNNQLLLKKEDNNQFRVPCGAELPNLPYTTNTLHEVTLPDGNIVYTVSIDEALPETEQWTMVDIRTAFDFMPLNEYNAAAKASQILYWDQHSLFCPACGTPTEHKASIMKKCPKCGHELYPPISPAVIVLIQRGDEILLIRARNFRGTHYGLVAGFLEVGETLEQCVKREVMEEVGLTIKNITYFDNQPWPYPSGQMIGFVADYESGEIKLQDEELSAGAFFTKENLPEIPRKLSLARKLIDWWREKQEN